MRMLYMLNVFLQVTVHAIHTIHYSIHICVCCLCIANHCSASVHSHSLSLPGVGADRVDAGVALRAPVRGGREDAVVASLVASSSRGAGVPAAVDCCREDAGVVLRALCRVVDGEM